jgi:hypothetical protein
MTITLKVGYTTVIFGDKEDGISMTKANGRSSGNYRLIISHPVMSAWSRKGAVKP